ncbi:MAG: heme ABC exporter ATP-binding protein CcmA [Pseudomonadota bacterium]
MRLNIRDLACRRGRRVVLAGVTLTLGAGQAAVLVGPNGSGKTTLLRTVAGLSPTARGQIQGGGEQAVFCGHSDAVKSQLTCAENLAFWAAIYGTGDWRPAAERFDLRPLLDRLAGDLSAGQRRRLGLARLLISGRPLWLMDEPTTALDTARIALWADAVMDHLRLGGAALIATHADIAVPGPRVDVSRFAATPDTSAQTGAEDPFLA